MHLYDETLEKMTNGELVLYVHKLMDKIDKLNELCARKDMLLRALKDYLDTYEIERKQKTEVDYITNEISDYSSSIVWKYKDDDSQNLQRP